MVFFVRVNNIIAGLVNNETQNKFNPYVPIIEVMLKNSFCCDKL